MLAGVVAVLTARSLSRQALNALNADVMRELNEALTAMDRDPSVGAVVLTGSEKAFVAGADIKMMEAMTFQDVFSGGLFDEADLIARKRKPIIGARGRGWCGPSR